MPMPFRRLNEHDVEDGDDLPRDKAAATLCSNTNKKRLMSGSRKRRGSAPDSTEVPKTGFAGDASVRRSFRLLDNQPADHSADNEDDQEISAAAGTYFTDD